MSKSKGNIVDPDHLIKTYGADTSRLFSLFAAPPEKDLEWNDEGVQGAFRFLSRVYKLVSGYATIQPPVIPSHEGNFSKLPPQTRQLRRLTHCTIKKVTEAIEREHQFNTAISALMELYNGLSHDLNSGPPDNPADIAQTAHPTAIHEAIQSLVILLSPFAPHLCEELWKRLGQPPSILQVPWPSHNPVLLEEETVEVVVQINGKLRSRLTAPTSSDEAALKEMALSDAKVQPWIEGRLIKNIFVVKGKLVNIVV